MHDLTILIDVDTIQEWNNIKEKVKEGVQETVDNDDDETDEKCWEDASVGEICSRILGFLDKKNYGKAMSLLKAAIKEFPQEELFTYQGADSSDSSDNEEEEEESKLEVKQYVSIIKNIFFEMKKKLEQDLSQNQSQVQSEDTEVNKQKMLVQYLTDSVKFSKVSIKKSRPITNHILFI